MSAGSEGERRISALLREAADLHHRMFRMTDGEDPNWASWYSEWLVNLSELPEIMGAAPVKDELIYLLVLLDKQYREQQPGQEWPDWYAGRILAHFSTSVPDNC